MVSGAAIPALEKRDPGCGRPATPRSMRLPRSRRSALPGSGGKARNRTNRRRSNRPASAAAGRRSPCTHKKTGTHPSAWFPSSPWRNADR
jgi:hypothetical protein